MIEIFADRMIEGGEIEENLWNGGQTEIRTQERSRVAGFQDRCIQPLCHLSATEYVLII